ALVRLFTRSNNCKTPVGWPKVTAPGNAANALLLSGEMTMLCVKLCRVRVAVWVSWALLTTLTELLPALKTKVNCLLGASTMSPGCDPTLILNCSESWSLPASTICNLLAMLLDTNARGAILLVGADCDCDGAL